MKTNAANHPACCGCSDCEDALTRHATKPFKSARAAKMAYTKAEKAWDAKRSEGHAARATICRTMREQGSMASDDYRACVATEKRCEAEAAVLFETARAIYNRAKEQGFYINSWHFGYNATRDLIAANMD